eukprot:jgi/Mesen1/5028/ME000025S04428
MVCTHPESTLRLQAGKWLLDEWRDTKVKEASAGHVTLSPRAVFDIQSTPASPQMSGSTQDVSSNTSRTLSEQEENVNDGEQLQSATRYLGNWNSDADAARAHDRAAINIFGRNASAINFPVSDYEDELAGLEEVPQQELVASLRSTAKQQKRFKKYANRQGRTRVARTLFPSTDDKTEPGAMDKEAGTQQKDPSAVLRAYQACVALHEAQGAASNQYQLPSMYSALPRADATSDSRSYLVGERGKHPLATHACPSAMQQPDNRRLLSSSMKGPPSGASGSNSSPRILPAPPVSHLAQEQPHRFFGELAIKSEMQQRAEKLMPHLMWRDHDNVGHRPLFHDHCARSHRPVIQSRSGVTATGRTANTSKIQEELLAAYPDQRVDCNSKLGQGKALKRAQPDSAYLWQPYNYRQLPRLHHHHRDVHQVPDLKQEAPYSAFTHCPNGDAKSHAQVCIPSRRSSGSGVSRPKAAYPAHWQPWQEALCSEAEANLNIYGSSAYQSKSHASSSHTVLRPTADDLPTTAWKKFQHKVSDATLLGPSFYA